MKTNTNDRLTINQILLYLLGLFLLLYCLLTLLPWSPIAFQYHLDESWASALHVAFANRIQFGKDFIYTYGPYGFLQVDRYFPETYSYAVIFRLLIALTYWSVLWKIMRCYIQSPLGMAIFLIPVLSGFPNFAISLDNLQFTLLILLLVLYFYVSKKISPVLVLSIMTAALASLTKHTYLLVCLVFIGLITIDELGKLKRIPRVAPIYLVFLWLFWTFAAQDLANFPDYMINGLEIVQGFSAVMGIAGDLGEIILYILGTGIFLLVVTIGEWKHRRWWGSLPTLGLAAVLFITFKGAFTRHDSHALQALFNTVPIIAIFTTVLWSDISKNSWRISNRIKLPLTLFWGTSVSTILIMGAIIIHNHLNYGYAEYSLKSIKHQFQRVPQVIKVIRGQGNFQAIADSGKAHIRSENILPSISGTVDLYPNETANIFANDFTYVPRPIIQSFSAYTSKLARLNVEHLRQPDAAENILFDLKPIDGHLASFEDGLSWPEILTLYDISNIEGRYLVLQRSEQPRQYQLEEISQSFTLGLDQWFDVPQREEPIWGKFELHPNFWGKLASTTLRLPPLYMEVETADGVQTKYRTIGDVMGEGFLLSPILANRWDFLYLSSPDWQSKLADKKVVKFRITSDGINAVLYPPTYQFSLSSLKFPRQDFTQVSGWQDLSEQIIPLAIDGTPQRTPINNNQQHVWLAHAPMKTFIELKGTEASLSFKFGILDEGIAGALQENNSDGVEFKIIALTDDKEQVIFSRKLQPRIDILDRGMQETQLDLSLVKAKKLIFETIPGENNLWDWSYWSEIKAK